MAGIYNMNICHLTKYQTHVHKHIAFRYFLCRYDKLIFQIKTAICVLKLCIVSFAKNIHIAFGLIQSILRYGVFPLEMNGSYVFRK